MDLKKLTAKELEERIERTSERIQTIIDISKDVKSAEAKAALAEQNKNYMQTLEGMREELKFRMSNR